MKSTLFPFAFLFFLSTISSAQNIQPFKDANGKWGLKSPDGSIKVQAVYDVMHSYFMEGRLAVNKGYKNRIEGNKEIIVAPGKWGFLDISGKEIIQLKYDRATGFNNGMSKVMINDKWGYINTDDKFIIPANYVFIENFNDNNFAIFNTGGTAKVKYSFYQMDYEGGKWGVMDRTGKAIIPAEYEKVVWVEKYKYFWVKKNSGCGVLSSTGAVMIAPQYDELFFRSNGLLIARSKNKYGAVSIKNDILVPIEYDQFPQQDFEKKYFTLIKDSKSYEFDLTGKTFLTIKSPEAQETIYRNAVTAAKNSGERGMALAKYIDAILEMNFTEDEKSFLLSQKVNEMIETDFMGFYEMVMKIKNENTVFVMKKIVSALSNEKQAAFRAAMSYTTEMFSSMQNGTPPPAWPAIVPQPGYGWGKTVSSDKAPSSPSNSTPQYRPANSAPVYNAKTTNPPAEDELTILKSSAKSIEGKKIFIVSENKCYAVPSGIKINNMNDNIYLIGFETYESYDNYTGLTKVYTRQSKYTGYSISARELVSELKTAKSIYEISAVVICGNCFGKGFLWNGQTRWRTDCSTCSATGCRPGK